MPAPGRTPRDSGRTRQELLRAGTALFARGGFEGTSTEEIARRARVNKALINYHFGGKQGLYDAILASLFEPASARFESLPDLPPEKAISELMSLVADTIGSRPDVAAILLREALAGGRHLDRTVATYLVRIFGAVRRILASGVATGRFRPADPLLVHLSLIGALLFFFGTRSFRARILAAHPIVGRPPEDDEFVRQLQQMFVRGLAAPAGRRSPSRSR